MERWATANFLPSGAKASWPSPATVPGRVAMTLPEGHSTKEIDSSWVPRANILPSGAKATAYPGSGSPMFTVASGLPVATSQIWQVPAPTAADTRDLPSAEKARSTQLGANFLSSPSVRWRSTFPLDGSHSRICSFPPPARTSPFGDQQTTGAYGGYLLRGSPAPSTVTPRHCRTSLPVVVSQMRTVPSSLPEARYLPSPEKDREATTSVCPSKRMCSLPVATSHSRILASLPPEASVLLSGEKARAKAPPFS